MVPDPKDVESIDPYMLAAITALYAICHVLTTMNMTPCTC
jgi:hypothetical protein